MTAASKSLVRRLAAHAVAAVTAGALVVTGSGVASAADRPPGAVAASESGVAGAPVTTATREATRISGWPTATTRVVGARWSAAVTISPGSQRTVRVEQRVGTDWVNRKTLRTGEAATAKLSVQLPGQWDDSAKTSWRLVVPATPTAEQAVSPTLVVTVTRAATAIMGWTTSASGVAGGTLKNRVTITPGNGRTVRVQQKAGSSWVTRATVKTRSATATPTITLPKQWYSQYTTQWRLVVEQTVQYRKAVSNTKVVKVKAQHAPAARYLQPQVSIAPVAGGGYRLTRGMNGVKVAKVRSKFRMSNYGRAATVSPQLMSRVASWQRAHGRRATGVVDRSTWTGMGFSASSWTALDVWTHPVKTTLASTRAQRVEAMVATAYSYRGSRYVWGGAGSPRHGADCSGMVLQALYSVGIDPRPITPVKHSRPSYRSTVQIYGHPKLKHVPLSQRKRGDVLMASNGSSHHVAIYLGRGKYIDMLYDGVRVRSFNGRSMNGLRTKPTVVRPLG